MRVLVVDDEPLARSVLRDFLGSVPEVSCIEECVDGASAASCLRRTPFDLMFLDVQMPSLTGMDLMRQWEGGELPLVVFVTAYEQHAVDAFAVDAVDYLLKPFDDRRFEKAIERVRRRLEEIRRGARGLDQHVPAPFSAPDLEYVDGQIGFRSGSDLVRVRLADIVWIEAENKHVLFHGADGVLLKARRALGDIERLLDPARFARVHRSSIVALPRVTALKRTSGGVAVAHLDTGARVVVSRSRASALEALLSSDAG